jgi:DNA primase
MTTLFTKESLELLRQRINLVEVLSSHLELKPSGASYKALCPFHDERTPSFMVQRGDSHYHCFGCGAHGDAIQFLMTHLKMTFLEAVESLAQRFHVQLQKVESPEENKGINKAALKEALEHACRFYHFYLLHSAQGHEALHYLYRRGIDLDFIRHFHLGLAPKATGVLRQVMHAKFVKDEVMAEAGLLVLGKDGRWREFFQDRITFPIYEASGAVIGFSARKFKEETFGGKYINTPETPLFKKSRVLFGLKYSRRRIAKERKAIIVEGQIDALRLIQAGFNVTVAGQGTAFGEGHVKELMALGLNRVYLALDSDDAGQHATYKVGDLFQKEGIEVRIVQMPVGSDPDAYLRDHGPKRFHELMENSEDYLSFLVSFLSRPLDMNSPAGKNELVQVVSRQIREWNHPLMVHESLRKLAHLVQVPESMIDLSQEYQPNLYIRKASSAGLQNIDPDCILESDFLRWLLLMGEQYPPFIEMARRNIRPEDLFAASCRDIYRTYLEAYENQRPCDLLSLAIHINHSEGQLLMSNILQKKVNKERAEPQFIDTIQKILDRNWMKSREEIRMRIQSGQCSEEEAFELVKQFDELKRKPPRVQVRAESDGAFQE